MAPIPSKTRPVPVPSRAIVSPPSSPTPGPAENVVAGAPASYGGGAHAGIAPESGAASDWGSVASIGPAAESADASEPPSLDALIDPASTLVAPPSPPFSPAAPED